MVPPLNPVLSIIIVNYKTADLTKRCIESIWQHHSDSVEIIVVDNHSCDGSAELITEAFPTITIIKNTSNDGFGRANNKGVALANGKYILLLNSDMIVEKDTINKCLNVMIANNDIGVLGCLLKNEDGSIQKSTYHYIGENNELWQMNLLADKLFSFKSVNIRAVMGSFLMMKKDDFVSVGGFDPDFFMYCEELDLCDRVVNLLKKRIFYFTKAQAIHKHGASSSSEWARRQTFLSRSLLVYKKKGVFYLISSHVIMHLTIVTNCILMWKLDKDYRNSWLATCRSYFANWLNYWKIPLTFARSMGKGKKMLRSA